MKFRSTKVDEPPVAMIIGLGNPGGEYRGTRHNVGFDFIDALAAKHRIKVSSGRHQAMTGAGKIRGFQVLLVKPLTFMNLSGRSVAPLMRQHSLSPAQVLVVADDKDLPTARLRMRMKGSAGGHNGHKSIIQSLGTEEYPRLKIGIGQADAGTVDHVLGKFTPEERVDIENAMPRALEGVEEWITAGISAAMNRINPTAE
jgi:PTH1 family peptidyl-tRNA hydrolase